MASYERRIGAAQAPDPASTPHTGGRAAGPGCSSAGTHYSSTTCRTVKHSTDLQFLPERFVSSCEAHSTMILF